MARRRSSWSQMEPHTLLAAAVIGLFIGFLGGLLGKGGSAIATPLLHAVGVPAIIAVAAPLPATIPSTLAASWVYWKERYLDFGIVRACVVWGVPATIVGALATRWISGNLLVSLTDVVLVGIGLRLLRRHAAPDETVTPVGSVESIVEESPAGGGVALAKLPIRPALATSLAVSAVLAIPGTIVHAALGHIDWTLVAVFAATSVPLSFAGARVAVRMDAQRLERIYGAVLVLLGATFLILR